MAKRVAWSRDELLLAFRLYCRTPFGRLHQRNPDIIELGRLLNRTASAVGMKACNFASLDPVQQARQIAALGNVSRADRLLWDEFQANPEAVAAEAEAAYERLAALAAPVQADATAEPDLPLPTAKPFRGEAGDGPTEAARLVRTRRVQSFFRAAVLAGYDNRCALTGLAVPQLVNASHIIPWSANVARRADPRNGIALNVLHDRAFDRGLITFDESLRLVLSPRLREATCDSRGGVAQGRSLGAFHRQALLALAGRQLQTPNRFPPDPKAMEYHRGCVFR